jgi:DNA-binding transcriptional regulator LsrR (DeoR family)
MANNTDRDEMLAFVAEKYYLEDHRQSDIAKMIGLTRSAVSRMLTEAREKGIVEIIIHHPFQFDHQLENKLKEVLGLQHASVVVINHKQNYDDMRKQLGMAGSKLLSRIIQPGNKIGVAWGTTVQETIESYKPETVPDTEVVQLVGVLGSTRHSYSAQILVERLAQKLGGEGIYLYTPFIVENRQTAVSLLEDPVVQEAISIGEKCDIALMGIGTTKPAFCSLYKGGHISLEELNTIQDSGAVGDVCALYYGIDGKLSQVEFNQHRIGLSYLGLKKIPTRLAVAGNIEKAEAILGAACGGFINSLVTDHLTAIKVLELAQLHCQN